MNLKDVLHYSRIFKNLDMKMAKNTVQHVKDGWKRLRLDALAVKPFLDTKLGTKRGDSNGIQI